MSTEIFEMFYAKVRANQYLENIINIVHFKDNYVPSLFIKNDKVHLLNDISYYHGKERVNNINNRIFRDIIYNPRTYLYDINKMANYNITPLINGQDSLEPVLAAFNKKIYKKVDAEIVKIEDHMKLD